MPLFKFLVWGVSSDKKTGMQEILSSILVLDKVKKVTLKSRIDMEKMKTGLLVWMLTISSVCMASEEGVSKQVQMLNSQIQAQLQQLQESQQKQLKDLNVKVQAQLLQMQTNLEAEIQKLNTQNQAQLKQIHDTIQQLQENH